MNALGTVAQCWCYPVKSKQGQARGELSITAAGVDGDRAWAVIDVAANRVLSAKRTAFPNHLGVYAQVRTPGPIRVGDPVILVS